VQGFGALVEELGDAGRRQLGQSDVGSRQIRLEGAKRVGVLMHRGGAQPPLVHQKGEEARGGNGKRHGRLVARPCVAGQGHAQHVLQGATDSRGDRRDIPWILARAAARGRPPFDESIDMIGKLL